MEKSRLVLDTNVLVSGVLSPYGPPGQIVDLVVAAQIQLVVEPRVLAEYADVLHRPELRLDADRIALLLQEIKRRALNLVVGPWRHPLPDPDDEPFLSLADAAFCPLVTGNLRHYPPASREKVTVFSPADYLAALRSSG